MRLLALLLCCLAVELHAQEPPVLLQFENMNVFDELPEYTESMSDTMFRKWVKAQNEAAYRLAQKKADEWAARNPALDTYLQINDYRSNSDLSQTENSTSSGASVGSKSGTDYKGRTFQRTFRTQTRWGGGPVVVINPYLRGNR